MSSTGNMHAGDGAIGFSHGTPRASEDGVELLNLEAKLNQPDSVLEKPEEVLEALKEYLKAGGKVQTAVQHLSNEYMGKDACTCPCLSLQHTCLMHLGATVPRKQQMRYTLEAQQSCLLLSSIPARLGFMLCSQSSPFNCDYFDRNCAVWLRGVLVTGYAAMADLMVEWADLVGMPLGPLLGPQAAGGSSGSLNKAYSIGPGSSRSLLSSPPAAAAAGAAGAGAAAGQEGAHLDVLLLQVRR
jgi:hypothetical protein